MDFISNFCSDHKTNLQMVCCQVIHPRSKINVQLHYINHIIQSDFLLHAKIQGTRHNKYCHQYNFQRFLNRSTDQMLFFKLYLVLYNQLNQQSAELLTLLFLKFSFTY